MSATITSPPGPTSTTPSADLHTYPLPSLKVRDFAYEPKPPIIELPVDPRWVVDKLPRRIPGVPPVDGAFQRHTQLWEGSRECTLYRTGRNRADPPGTKPKLWGGLSKEDDEKKWQEVHGAGHKVTAQLTGEDLEKGVCFINNKKRRNQKGGACKDSHRVDAVVAV